MQPTIKDIFEKIQNAEVQTEPFDHLVVDNLLPDDFFKELAKELEAEDFPSNYQKGPYGGKDRFGVDITDYHSFRNSRREASPTKVHSPIREVKSPNGILAKSVFLYSPLALIHSLFAWSAKDFIFPL